jgi:hypothetical protein
MALLSLLSALSIVGITQYNQQRLLHERTDKLGNALASRMAASAARPLVQSDALSLQAALAEFVGEPVVQRAVVFDLKQQLIAAAGDEKPDSWDYSATIHWQDSVIGRAVLSLRPVAAQNAYPQLGDLILLSLILTALSAACGLRLGHRAEAVLSDLTRKLSGEQIELDYRGTDILARMLDIPPPPVLTSEPVAVEQSTLFMHVSMSNASMPNEQTAGTDDADNQRALNLVQTLTKLYSGKAEVTRSGAITACFPISEDFEGPFRALCCAQLLQLFEKQSATNYHFRIALAVLAADEAQNIWHTQKLIDRLQTVCTQSSIEGLLLVDNQLQRHPAISERCTLEENGTLERNGTFEKNDSLGRNDGLEEKGDGFWRVTGLNTPYDVLLERQFATLREQVTA